MPKQRKGLFGWLLGSVFSPMGLVTIILGTISLWLLFLPNDLIPDTITPIGLVDDAMILLFAGYVGWKVRRKYLKRGDSGKKYPLFG